jgi:hypothetical protein
MESKRDLAINQVPITTKQADRNYYIDTQLRAVTLIVKEESPYNPEIVLRSGSNEFFNLQGREFSNYRLWKSRTCFAKAADKSHACLR